MFARSLYKGQLLLRVTRDFYKKYHQMVLPVSETIQFIDFWLVIIIINDTLTITGTVMKIILDSSQLTDVHDFTACSFFLGTGSLLVWVGILRYLAYFKSYNIVMVTLKRAAPNVLRFLACAMLIFCGFCCCGWVVLGPHHLKFRTLSRTAECLFSLMNGDDMFATFFITDVANHSLIWYFSRVYIYVYNCLFIYVIVSLFISIILDAYESVRDFYAEQQGNKEHGKGIIEVSLCCDGSNIISVFVYPDIHGTS